MGVLDQFRLDGKVAIVTGASNGLGVELAVALAEAGADVSVAARRADRLTETVERIEALDRRGIAKQCDIADPDSCTSLAQATVTELGRLDVLVNNAGIAGDVVPASRESVQHFRNVIDINLNGTYWMSQSAALAMSAGGSIINIASVLALTTTMLPHAAYSASKAGVIGVTRDLARQWTGRKGIRVNAVAPGFFRTEMTATMDPEFSASVLERVAEHRLGEPRELTGSVLYLASDASSYVTGQTLIIDGGLSIS